MATPVAPVGPVGPVRADEAERRPAQRSPPVQFVQSAPPPRLIGPVGGDRDGAVETGAVGSAPAGAELAPGTGRGGYRLSTRALAPDYGQHKRGVMAEAAALRPASEPPMLQQQQQQSQQSQQVRDPQASEPWQEDRVVGRGGGRELLALRGAGHGPPALFSADQIAAPVAEDIDDVPAPSDRGVPPREAVPQLLTCLPGPVALFAERDALLAVDLRRLRSHLVYLRLQRDLIGKRVVAVQGLLAPAVVRRPVEEVALIVAARAELLTLGVDLDSFGDDAVVVRGVPAHLRHCVDDADVADLIARIVPWLRVRTRETDTSAVERGLLGAIAATRGADPAPRLARRWLAELLDAGATLTDVPGLRRWTAAALLGETAGVPRRAIALGHDDGAPV